MSPSIKVSAQDKKWQRESDARTLAEAEIIKSDKKRMNEATKGAKEIAKEKMADAKAMVKIASKLIPTKKSSGTTRKGK